LGISISKKFSGVITTMSTKLICTECVNKQEEIYRLREENKRLKDKIRRDEQKSKEGYFGSSTPSSKKPIKKNTKNESPKKMSGAKPGHIGKGRISFTEDTADHVESVTCEEEICPGCQVELKEMRERNRSVLTVNELKLNKILYKLHRRRCPRCKQTFSAKAPETLPKALLNNELMTHIAAEHYVDGIPMGLLEQKLNINNGTLFQGMHRLAELLKDVPDLLIQNYRQTLVKFADETTWRTDGHNGYAWLFSTNKICVYRIRLTRASSVVTEVLGKEPLSGVLVVDRYQGYNKAPSDIQYCFEHLRRPTEDLIKEFPKSEEIKNFVDKAAPLLSKAMGLRSQKISDEQYYKKAAKLKANIIDTMNKPAKHAGIIYIQSIFLENSSRLYHWVDNRDIPAENNYSERGFRRLIISRKISFGSQSEKGAKTREILMTVLHSLRKQYPDNFRNHFKKSLNQLAINPKLDPYKLLFSNDTS